MRKVTVQKGKIDKKSSRLAGAALRKAGVLTLTAAMLLTLNPVRVLAEDSPYPEKEHSNTPYEERQSGIPDRSKIDELLTELEERTTGDKKSDKDNADQLKRIYADLLEQVNQVQDMTSIDYVESMKHGSDDKVAQVYEDANNETTEILNDVASALRDAIALPEGDPIREEMTEDQQEAIDTYETMSDEELELSQEENDLITRYWDAAMAYSEVYTGEETEEVSAAGEKCADIYKQLLQLRLKDMEDTDYDSLAEYYYTEAFYRDYSPEDIASLRDVIHGDFLDLVSTLAWISYDMGSADLDLTVEEQLDTARGVLEDLDPSLTEAFDYMRKNNLVDLDASDDKQEQGFTMSMYSYGDAFTYNAPGGTNRDFRTMVHEYGHYNAAFHNTNPVLYDSISIDVAEIQSQGLEVLFLDKYTDMFGEEEGKKLAIEQLLDLLSSVLQAAMVDEFEQTVAENPDMSYHDMNKLYYNLCDEYGYVVSDDEDEDSSWVMINHIFEVPFYYISYMTSVLPALQIWVDSGKNYDKAVQEYMTISTMTNQEYVEALDEAGMKNPVSKDAMSKLASDLYNRLILSGYASDYLDDEVDPDDWADDSSEDLGEPFMHDGDDGEIADSYEYEDETDDEWDDWEDWDDDDYFEEEGEIPDWFYAVVGFWVIGYAIAIPTAILIGCVANAKRKKRRRGRM